jgi:hypothetical protein
MSLKDNKNCPVKMSDGRIFTNYEPRCVSNDKLNKMLKENNMVSSSYEQRLFLQHNYDKIVEAERQKTIESFAPCVPCTSGELINEKNPELDNKYAIYCNEVSCTQKLINEKGLGTGKFF